VDFKVSRKEKRWQADGPVDVLVDNVCDLYPVFASDPIYAGQAIQIGQDTITGQDRENIVMDVEIIDDDRAELLDRAMFALMKQRGADPVELNDGVQWAEAVIGEVPPSVILQQVQSAVFEEGPGVRATAAVIKNGSRENLFFKVELTNAV